jgi:hypothetical protein
VERTKIALLLLVVGRLGVVATQCYHPSFRRHVRSTSELSDTKEEMACAALGSAHVQNIYPRNNLASRSLRIQQTRNSHAVSHPVQPKIKGNQNVLFISIFSEARFNFSTKILVVWPKYITNTPSRKSVSVVRYRSRSFHGHRNFLQDLSVH